MLVAVLLLAFNLRPAAVSVGPVLPEVRSAFGMSGAEAGLLTALPVLAFAFFGALAPAASRLVGLHRVTLLALVALTGGLLGRATSVEQAAFFLLSLIALAGMAMANVLIPSLVKLHFPDRIAQITAWYTTALAVGLTCAFGLTVPVADAAGGWRVGLGGWAALALLATALWVPMAGYPRRELGPQKALRYVDVAKTPLGISMALFFGLQGLHAYAAYGWFAQMWRDGGWSPQEAGLLIGLLAAVTIPLSLWLPRLLGRQQRPARLLLAVVGCYVLGYGGLLLDVKAAAPLCALLIGAGSCNFPLILTLIGQRARTPEGTAALSAFTQSTGYLLAATGPFVVGVIHQTTGSWTWPIVLLLVLCGPLAATAVVVARPQFIEDQCRARPPSRESTAE